MEIAEGEKFPEKKEGSLGEGSISKVDKVRVKHGGHKDEIYAMKQVKFDKISDSKLELIMKNIVHIHHLQHKNIMAIKFSFFDSNSLYLGMHHMEGGAINRILERKFPDGIKNLVILATILKSVLEAIVYLHSNKFIHRDIKGSNILIGGDGQVQLTDHGLSAKLKKGKKRETLVGSPCWMAPEVIDSDSDGYGLEVDIWSLGITAIELAEGRPPHYDKTGMETILKILKDQPPQLNDDSVGALYCSFVSDCLQKDSTQRPSAEELLTKYKKIWSKAKDGKYLVEKLGPFDDSENMSVFDFRKSNSKKRKSDMEEKIVWDFGLGEDEDDQSNAESDYVSSQI